MKKLEIVLDEETDRILESLAAVHSGDKNLAIREALQMHGTVEVLLDQIEELHSADLRQQKERSERGFRKGKFARWEEVKQKTGL